MAEHRRGAGRRAAYCPGRVSINVTQFQDPCILLLRVSLEDLAECLLEGCTVKPKVWMLGQLPEAAVQSG